MANKLCDILCQGECVVNKGERSVQQSCADQTKITTHETVNVPWQKKKNQYSEFGTRFKVKKLIYGHLYLPYAQTSSLGFVAFVVQQSHYIPCSI